MFKIFNTGNNLFNVKPKIPFINYRSSNTGRFINLSLSRSNNTRIPITNSIFTTDIINDVLDDSSVLVVEYDISDLDYLAINKLLVANVEYLPLDNLEDIDA